MKNKVENIVNLLAGDKKLRCLSCSNEKDQRIVNTTCVFNKKSFIDDKGMLENHLYFINNFDDIYLYYNKCLVDDIEMEFGIHLFGKESLNNFETHLGKNIDGMSIIGRNLSSSDLYLASKTGFYFMDQEVVLSKNKLDISDATLIANDIESFLEVLLKEPIKYIDGTWRFMEDFFSQWYPIEVVNN